MKCVITMNQGEDAEISVTGYLSEGSNFSLSSVWTSPFAADSVGSIALLDKAASIGQAHTGSTAKAQWNTTTIWEGTEPPDISLTLHFHALVDGRTEVDEPIKHLLQFASPELSETVGMGRTPDEVVVNIGGKMQLKAVIKNVSYDLTAPKTRDGHFASNTVTIEMAPKAMFNASQIPNIFK
ncbi:hypothetical protein [Thaumasiovibrio sp. DFM-14]|uniref:hypothetical protein n=1 Tax=Thaumasiovibrio sp. DFM-14 TaxID=3384792 RepID=UPI0039A3DBEE